MPRRLSILCMLLLCGASCTISETLERLDQESPPPELGRPDWVRFMAKTGAVLGVIPGAVASAVLLPITYPIALLADEPLGYSRQEFLFMPVGITASAGHFFLGAPADMLDYVFHRAWSPPPEPATYEQLPLALPVEGAPAEPTATPEPAPGRATLPGAASRSESKPQSKPQVPQTKPAAQDNGR